MIRIPIQRQMTFVPHYIKVCDDLLFVKLEISGSSTTYRCLHIPTLVLSTQLPDGSLDLTEKVFSELPPECKMETYTAGSIGSVHEEIYSIPSCRPTHLRYCFILSRVLERSTGMDWEVLEVEINSSIPGPIKIFSEVSRQYTVPRPTYFFHDGDTDLLISLPSKHGHIPHAPVTSSALLNQSADNLTSFNWRSRASFWSLRLWYSFSSSASAVRSSISNGSIGDNRMGHSSCTSGGLRGG
jgi:hypothetical protein